MIILLLLLVLGVAGTGLYVDLTRKAEDSGATAEGGAELPADELKQLALKLEKQGLRSAAAAVWQEYLTLDPSDDLSASAIWYRIGGLYQYADEHEEALHAFYRAESLGLEEDLESETNRKVQKSLEALGKFAALKHELSERVGLNADAGEKSTNVVAEIGTQKITLMELDRQIESAIEKQLAMMGGRLSDEQRRDQKARLLKQFASGQQRLNFLNGFLTQELLYRKARESELIEDPRVREQLQDSERTLLAGLMMDSELKNGILITQNVIQFYYDGRKAQFVEAASAAISHLVVADEETAGKAIARIEGGEEFAQVAAEISQDEATREQGGEVAGRLVKGSAASGLPLTVPQLEPVFGTEAGTILKEPLKSDQGFHVVLVREVTPERQRHLEEVSEQIRMTLQRLKEQEIQEKLIRDLREEYDVVIHQDVLGVSDKAE